MSCHPHRAAEGCHPHRAAEGCQLLRSATAATRRRQRIARPKRSGSGQGHQERTPLNRAATRRRRRLHAGRGSRGDRHHLRHPLRYHLHRTAKGFHLLRSATADTKNSVTLSVALRTPSRGVAFEFEPGFANAGIRFCGTTVMAVLSTGQVLNLGGGSRFQDSRGPARPALWVSWIP